MPSCFGAEKERQMGKGTKYDDGKPAMTLLPWRALEAVAIVQMYGATKYDRDNWKLLDDPIDRYLRAAIRHFGSYLEGETSDRESGLPHLAHGACNALFALWFHLKDHPLQQATVTKAMGIAASLRASRTVVEDKRKTRVDAIADSWAEADAEPPEPKPWKCLCCGHTEFKAFWNCPVCRVPAQQQYPDQPSPIAASLRASRTVVEDKRKTRMDAIADSWRQAEDVFTCGMCGYSTFDRGVLYQHQVSHACGRKPLFKCETCGYTDSKQHVVEEHIARGCR
jgi:hypothetical protein